MSKNTDTDSDTPGRNTNRAETGLYASQYSTDTIIETLERGDVVGTQDVADALGCVYDTAYKRLRKLEDEGRVRSQKVANTRIWELADVREDE
jgi:predicted ArsR family transcriptional regulator